MTQRHNSLHQICRSALVFALVLTVLSGCGGGSSSQALDAPPSAPAPSSPPPAPQPPPVELSAASIAAASRFTAQATFGLAYDDILSVANAGHAQWLDSQFELAPTYHTPIVQDLLARRARGEFAAFEEDVELLVNFRRYSWWHHAITAEDEVRQRIALALSEILVVSDQVDALLLAPQSLSTYYDLLLDGAFGNFRDLLHNVALHPAMGLYLSHVNNAKADPASNRFPDENFAREVMQLFSIGLFELNNDGSERLAADGLPIATYSNADIREFAKIFTGLSWGGEGAFFGNTQPNFVATMQMFDAFHEPGEKRLLNGLVVPAGQSGLDDIAAAIDNLFNHPNTGPFIGRQLIQRLVTSNPSPAYIDRVAGAFNDNGAGVRGDMRAVVRAILFDPEAETPLDPTRAGKLRAPMVRNVAMLRQLEVQSSDGFFFHSGFLLQFLTGQSPLSAPSVFNFYLPNHRPTGPLGAAELFAPELQITNSTTIAGITNLIDIGVNGEFFLDGQPPLAQVTVDFSELEALAVEPAALVERLDLTFTYGAMSQGTQELIIDIIEDLADNNLRVKTALYITLTSPDYAVRI